MQLLADLTREEMVAWVAARGLLAYRGRQLYAAVFRRLATSFDELTDLPRDVRTELAQEASLVPLLVQQRHRDKQAETEKALFRLADGALVEGVLMDYPGERGGGRHTVCLSTQVGCALGCRFCATGLQGWTRDLSPGEIAGQVLHFERVLRARGARVTNVVYMGMGEPLLPYENTLTSVRLLTDPHGFGLGQRHVTISTAGIVPGIRRLAREGLQVGLAVSIHAATDEARSALMPLNRRWGLDELLDACRDYVEATHRRITFECTLIGGVNDGPDDARALAERLRGLLCHVNLIPWNRVDEIPFQPSSRARVAAFRDVLAAAGLPVTVRDTRGSAIQAACGQLKTASTRARRATLRPVPVATA
jgi:23S rRNA (adenine2503-C2)-methyltransferase